jgi:hypothetical protein
MGCGEDKLPAEKKRLRKCVTGIINNKINRNFTKASENYKAKTVSISYLVATNASNISEMEYPGIVAAFTAVVQIYLLRTMSLTIMFPMIAVMKEYMHDG